MAWRRSSDNPLSEPMMISLLTHICAIHCIPKKGFYLWIRTNYLATTAIGISTKWPYIQTYPRTFGSIVKAVIALINHKQETLATQVPTRSSPSLRTGVDARNPAPICDIVLFPDIYNGSIKMVRLLTSPLVPQLVTYQLQVRMCKEGL